MAPAEPIRSRSRCFWILPVLVFGTTAKRTSRGHLKRANSERQCSTMSSSVSPSSRSPLRSLNFATLRVKDAVADRFRERAGGVRPSIDTQRPDARVTAHLSASHATLYIDTSGEPLFKRGWRQDKGDAPLKETLAAAMLAASGWWQPAERRVAGMPLYDPCCGSGTIVIEAAQLVLGLPPGGQRRIGRGHGVPSGIRGRRLRRRKQQQRYGYGDDYGAQAATHAVLLAGVGSSAPGRAPWLLIRV